MISTWIEEVFGLLFKYMILVLVHQECKTIVALLVVGGSQQETLDPSFVLLATRQQGVPVILRELVLPGSV
ncbi:unnamed protein product [Schistosoma margrebowiei]|uniref:Uncharacterized protein n=1 Tax=Schistosoma margrebowiei TaxID=48269 RepID=A0A183MPE8_9TREM|nr:unnamed protein product [Schistosoma margrebowiei]